MKKLQMHESKERKIIYLKHGKEEMNPLTVLSKLVSIGNAITVILEESFIGLTLIGRLLLMQPGAFSLFLSMK